MTAQKRLRSKKYYTVAEANAMLPLLRSILRDITELARDLQERQERLARVKLPTPAGMEEAYREELKESHRALERDKERMKEYFQELQNLHVELKDCFTGLVDFPCLMNERPVYLCWRLGEPEVAYWHEIDAGFAGRKKLGKAVTSSKG